MGMTAKLAISLPRSLLTEIDEMVSETHQSRSAIIREAVETFVSRFEVRRATQRAAAVYEAIAEEERRLNRVFRSVAEETLPTYVGHKGEGNRARATKS